MDKKDKRILIVDDEVNIRRALVYALKKQGYVIFEAMDGMTALDIVQKESINLIFLDVMLPDIDGYEVCKRIKSNPETKQIHIIILTATRTQEIDSINGLKCGADRYILKPFSIANIVSQVEEILCSECIK